MASGTINGSTSSGYISARIKWSSTVDTDANKSTVKAYLYYKKSSSSNSKTYGNFSGSITINGTKKSVSRSLTLSPNNSWVYAGSATVTVSHGSDGKKSIKISASGGISSTSFTSTSLSKTVALDNIPRTSTVIATNANIGSATKITINKASSKFTHTLTCLFGTTIIDIIAVKTDASSLTWTVPTSLYAKMPNAKSGTCTINCTTYNGSTDIGFTSSKFTVTASESDCKPTLSPTVVDTNSVTSALTGDNSKLIKYYSTASTDSNATARNSATLASQNTTNGSKTISTETGTFPNVEDGTFTFSATDSRGYTTVSTKKVTMIDYVKLTCNLTANNPTADGNMTFTISGNYFNNSFGSVSNTLTVQYRYKKSDGSYGNWINLAATTNGNTYTAPGNLTGLDYESPYTFQARALDKLTTINSKEVSVKSFPIFDWSSEDFNFNVPVYAYNKVKLFYEAGDSITYNSSSVQFSGHITSSKKSLHFTIPISKPILANSVTIGGNIIVRGISGYANTGDTSVADNRSISMSGENGYTTQFSIHEGIGIHVYVSFASEIQNVTNNTPVTVNPYGDITITFT